MVKPSVTIHGKSESRDDELKRKGDEFLDALHAFVMGKAELITYPATYANGYKSAIRFQRFA